MFGGIKELEGIVHVVKSLIDSCTICPVCLCCIDCIFLYLLLMLVMPCGRYNCSPYYYGSCEESWIVVYLCRVTIVSTQIDVVGASFGYLMNRCCLLCTGSQYCRFQAIDEPWIQINSKQLMNFHTASQTTKHDPPQILINCT